MEGFRPNQKMKSELACYKEGGSVSKKELMKRLGKETKEEKTKDMEQDKGIVKKAMAQHDKQQHEEKTELKLKKGGRSKKDGGTVKRYMGGGKSCAKKFQAGGAVAGEAGQTPPMVSGPHMGMPAGYAGAPGGMGVASASGGLGHAAPMGPMEDVFRGLRAVGQYARGGKI